MAWGTSGAQTQICVTPSLRLLPGAWGLSLPGKQPFCSSLCRNRKLTASEANSPPGPAGANRGPRGWVSPSPSPSPRAVEACVRHPRAVHRGLTTLCFLIPAKPRRSPSCSVGIEFTASREQGSSSCPGPRWRGNHDTARPLLPRARPRSDPSPLAVVTVRTVVMRRVAGRCGRRMGG